MHIVKAKNIMMYHYEMTHDSHQEYNAFTFIFVSYMCMHTTALLWDDLYLFKVSPYVFLWDLNSF